MRGAAALCTAIAVCVLALSLAVVIGGLVGSTPPTAVVVLAAGVALCAGVPIWAGGSGRGLDLFHPLVAPFAYLAIAVLLPPAYMIAAQRTVAGIRPNSVSFTLALVLTLTVVVWAAGVLAGLRITRRGTTGNVEEVRWDRILLLGRMGLLAAIGLRLYSTGSDWGLPYGTGSVNFGEAGAVQNATDLISFAAPVLVVLGHLRLRGAVAGRFDLVVFAAFVVVTLASGSRGELLVPVIFAMWAHQRWVRPLPIRGVAVAAVVTAVVFQGVQGVRAGDSPVASPRAATERTLTALGVPMQVTALTTGNVPTKAGYRHGATYLEAVKRQIPGVLAVRIWGPPRDTGSFVLRRIIRFNNPNAGLGYALPAESYLNFGIPGAAVIAALVGALFAFAYRKQDVPAPTRAIHVLYGLLVATLPISLRADALLQIKSVLYPMLALVLALAACRIRSSPTVELTPEREREVQAAPH